MALAKFQLPPLNDNTEGWGPPVVSAEHPVFGVWNKGDRLGKVLDWTQSKAPQRGKPTPGGSGYYKQEEDEASFNLVDTRPKPKPKFGRRFPRRFPLRRGGPPRRNSRGPPAQEKRNGKFRNNTYGRRGGSRWGAPYERVQDVKEPSIEIRETWKKLETIEFSALSDKSWPFQRGETLVECGVLSQYKPNFDTITPKNPVALVRAEKRMLNPSIREDPVLKRLIAENAGNVYATDTVLAVLMASPRSVNSWDIVLRKENGISFLDKRAKSKIDVQWVNENCSEVAPTEKDSVNHPNKLAEEATTVNFNFQHQALAKDEPLELDEPNPFTRLVEKPQELPSVAYKYRRWQLGEDLRVVARTVVNAYAKKGGASGGGSDDVVHLAVRALTEYDSKLAGNIDWKQKIESQIGGVMATEIKNNANKLTRWIAEAILADVDELRIGFVSRVQLRDALRHSLVLTKKFKPSALLQSSPPLHPKGNSGLWGTLKYILERTKELPDGTYLIFKEPTQAALSIFEVHGSVGGDEDYGSGGAGGAQGQSQPPAKEEEHQDE